jgi:hypothetical protein
MRADWRECQREERSGQWSAIYVTLNAKGYIVLGKTAYQRLGEPKAFLLLYDGTNNRIGLKPTAAGIRNAFPAAKSGRHGGRLIRALRLLNEFGIDVKETLQFPDAEIDHDGVLILDMRSARVSSRAIVRRRAEASMK